MQILNQLFEVFIYFITKKEIELEFIQLKKKCFVILNFKIKTYTLSCLFFEKYLIMFITLINYRY